MLRGRRVAAFATEPLFNCLGAVLWLSHPRQIVSRLDQAIRCPVKVDLSITEPLAARITPALARYTGSSHWMTRIVAAGKKLTAIGQ